MNYFEMIKQINEQRREYREKQQQALQENSEASAIDVLPPLTSEQRTAMKKQNLLIRYIAERMGMETFAISRDKAGHPLILTFRNLEGKSTPELYCYTLGVNTETNKVYPFCVGKNTFKFTRSFGYVYPTPSQPNPDNLHINILSIHPAFDGLGIGRVLMQGIENFAILNGMNSMSLNQELSYVRKNTTPTSKNKNEQYYAENFFDKNMYFYYSQGFELDKCERYGTYITTDLKPLKKEKLKRITLDYGFDKPLVKVDINDKIFKVPTASAPAQEIVKTFGYNNFFPMFLNNIPSEEFSPIVLKPNDSYTRFFHALLSTRKAKPMFTPTTINKKDFGLRVIRERNIEQSFHYDPTCSSPRFIEKVMNDYDNLLDARMTTQQGKPIPDLHNLLTILQERYDPLFKGEQKPPLDEPGS